jgi:hypothetical protein
MKNKKESQDFFARYHRARVLQYLLPGFFGMFLALGLVSVSHTSDMRGLMASVAQVAQPQYDADIVMERRGDGVVLIMGKTAQKVDTISFRLLSNPADAIVFAPSAGTIVSEGEGMTAFVRSFAHTDVVAGTVIAMFPGIDAKFPLALTDAEFTKRYSLTSKGE